jgi:hypothetical protein
VEAFILLLIFSAGIATGSYLTAKILTYRAKKRMQKRGEALRAITYHKWDTGEHNDAVIITRIAIAGLEYD